MRVLFERAGWQIVNLNDDDDNAYIRHCKCKESIFTYYMYNHKCTVCGASPPANIQALRVLYNWDRYQEYA